MGGRRVRYVGYVLLLGDAENVQSVLVVHQGVG